MIKKTRILLTVSALGFSQFSIAGEWSAGIFGGSSSTEGLRTACYNSFPQGGPAIDVIGVFCDVDESDSSIGLNASYNFNQMFGVEVGLVDLGSFYINANEGAEGGFIQDTKLDVTTGYLAGAATFNLDDKWAVTGRLGFYNTDVKIRSEFPGLNIDVDEGVYAGASLDYAFTENWTAQIRYDNFDIEATSFGLKYNFE